MLWCNRPTTLCMPGHNRSLSTSAIEAKFQMRRPRPMKVSLSQNAVCFGFSFPRAFHSLVGVIPNTPFSWCGSKLRPHPLSPMGSTTEFRGRRRVRTSMTQEGGEDKEKSDPTGGENRDWDSSWSAYQQKKSGGVFQLPDQRTTNKTQDMIDKRTERITSAWANENGFLLAIGGILLIAAFYSYVYATGGISQQ